MDALEIAGIAAGIAASLVVVAGAAVGIFRWLAARRGRGGTAQANVTPPSPPSPPSPSATGITGATHVFYGPVTFNIYVDGLPTAEPKVRDPFEEGRHFQDQDRHDEALRAFNRAFAAATDARQRTALQNLMGIGLTQTGRVAAAAEMLQQAVGTARSVRDMEGQAAALGNLGLVYARRGDLHRAEDFFRQSLAVYEEIGVGGWKPDSVRRALARIEEQKRQQPQPPQE